MATRVIGGEYRSRILRTPKGSDTRPTRSMVREAMFNMLQGRIQESQVLDLFAGSGALGLEAISRGAAFVVFVDAWREAVDVVKANVASLQAQERSIVLYLDCFAGIRWLKERKRQFDLVFLDPPYQMDRKPVLEALRDDGLLMPDGLLVIEHSAANALVLPDGFALWRNRVYGETALSIVVQGVKNE